MTTGVKTSIFIVAVLICAQSVQAQMGPLNVDILKAGLCEGTNNDILSMEVISIDEVTKGVNGHLNLPYDMDQTVSYAIVVDKIADGEIQESAFRHDGSCFCEDIEKFMGDFWLKMAADADMPDGCPKPKGNYKIENHPFDYNDIKLEKFLYGRFLMHVKLARLGEEVACVTIEFTNTPPGEGKINTKFRAKEVENSLLEGKLKPFILKPELGGNRRLVTTEG
ncbi:hypothetical protein CBL_12681 [Carabus blaptoides fortunei]